MALRTRNLSSALTLLVALAAAACGDETGPADPMREGLRAGALPLDSLVWIERGELVHVVAPVQTPGDAVAWVDHARARAGLDARLSGMYSAHGTTVEVRGCGDARMAPMVAGEWELLGATSESEQELLVQVAPRLLGWAASCDGATVAPTSVQIALVPGAPVGVAWWPADSLLLVNPAVLHVLGTAEAAGRQVETREQAVIGHDGYAACIEELSAECETCLASSGADCEALFASGETCVELSELPEGNTRYCGWRVLEQEPWRLWCVRGWAGNDQVLSGCYDRSIVVTSVHDLGWAIDDSSVGTGWCALAVAQCAAQEPSPLEGFVAHYDQARCTEDLAAYCEACAHAGSPGCAPLFPNSTGQVDCRNLRRAELSGLGPELYCTIQQVEHAGVDCLNYQRHCVEPDAWTRVSESFESLVVAMSRFITERSRCVARLAECQSMGTFDPFPNYRDEGHAPPTYDPFASSRGGGGGGEKCGG